MQILPIAMVAAFYCGLLIFLLCFAYVFAEYGTHVLSTFGVTAQEVNNSGWDFDLLAGSSWGKSARATLA